MFLFQIYHIYLVYINIGVLFLYFMAAMWTFMSENEGMSGYGKSLVDGSSDLSIQLQVQYSHEREVG
jgi:hypothetical protein